MGPKKKNKKGGGENVMETDKDIMSLMKKGLAQKKLLDDAATKR